MSRYAGATGVQIFRGSIVSVMSFSSAVFQEDFEASVASCDVSACIVILGNYLCPRGMAQSPCDPKAEAPSGAIGGSAVNTISASSAPTIVIGEGSSGARLTEAEARALAPFQAAVVVAEERLVAANALLAAAENALTEAIQSGNLAAQASAEKRLNEALTEVSVQKQSIAEKSDALRETIQAVTVSKYGVAGVPAPCDDGEQDPPECLDLERADCHAYSEATKALCRCLCRSSSSVGMNASADASDSSDQPEGGGANESAGGPGLILVAAISVVTLVIVVAAITVYRSKAKIEHARRPLHISVFDNPIYNEGKQLDGDGAGLYADVPIGGRHSPVRGLKSGKEGGRFGVGSTLATDQNDLVFADFGGDQMRYEEPWPEDANDSYMSVTAVHTEAQNKAPRRAAGAEIPYMDVETLNRSDVYMDVRRHTPEDAGYVFVGPDGFNGAVPGSVVEAADEFEEVGDSAEADAAFGFGDGVNEWESDDDDDSEFGPA